MTAPLLLYSLASFHELTDEILDVVGARAVIEVGSEDGLFAAELGRWADRTRADVYCIDPAPQPPLEALAHTMPRIQLVRGVSPEVLEELPVADVYFLDGDHNYHTVLRELRTIHRRAEEAGVPTVVVLQDVGWPWGRRDLYYAPDRLPPEAVHPHSFELGLTLESDELVEGGFESKGSYAIALHAGGPRNGVLTALEDFLSDRDDLSCLSVPAVFGLAVVFPRWARYASDLRETLAPYVDNPLLARMEHNRLELYLRVLDLQRQMEDLREERDRLRHEVRRPPDQAREQAVSAAETEVEADDIAEVTSTARSRD